MYSTKRVNKNLVDNNAYITIGDPYSDPAKNPFRQPKKGDPIPTPFQIKMIPQNEENGNFGKLRYQPCEYSEGIKYITTQPLDTRKNGFGTKDATKTDEFSNNIRTEQYRDQLKREKMFAAGKSAMKETLSKLLEAREEERRIEKEQLLRSTRSLGKISYDEQVSQYDIGRGRTTDFNPKSIKDTYYKFEDEREKRFGMTKPVSYDIGNCAWDIVYKPPSHGGKSEVRNFFDKSHLGTRQYS